MVMTVQVKNLHTYSVLKILFHFFCFKILITQKSVKFKIGECLLNKTDTILFAQISLFNTSFCGSDITCIAYEQIFIFTQLVLIACFSLIYCRPVPHLLEFMVILWRVLLRHTWQVSDVVFHFDICQNKLQSVYLFKVAI